MEEFAKRNPQRDVKIGVIGLGYVGLPLLIEFAKLYDVVGYDIDGDRIHELHEDLWDRTGEVSDRDLEETTAQFTNEIIELASCNIYIVTVPTPVNDANQPDMTPLISASTKVGSILKHQNLVIYESTVYPGATEEVCVPILEETSGLKFNENFFVGYSPERINPGDPERGVTTIKKVTAGSTPDIAKVVDILYGGIIEAGTYMASSIKVAEAAKVIENTQRDVNIALINELAMIFKRMDIDTEEVLKAAGTKWNFLPFRPGLVGGHCIGVDPYYLTHKAQELGYHPNVILSGRRVNDGMGAYIAGEVVKSMSKNLQSPAGSNALILGYTFKENCPDTRNTKVVDIIQELQEYSVFCCVYDPVMDKDERLPDHSGHRIKILDEVVKYDVIILAVAHNEFREMGVQRIRQYGKTNALVFDVKHLFPAEDTDWRL